MEVNNNSKIDNSLLVSNGINVTIQKTEDTTSFKDAAKVEIADPTAKKVARELSNETQQFLANNGVEVAKESANFDKQSVLAVAGSMTVAHGHVNGANVRALLS